MRLKGHLLIPFLGSISNGLDVLLPPILGISFMLIEKYSSIPQSDLNCVRIETPRGLISGGIGMKRKNIMKHFGNVDTP